MDGIRLALFSAVLGMMFAAAVLDIRSRRFPNSLAGALCCACAALSLTAGGGSRLAGCLVVSCAITVLLTLWELGWRKAHGGEPGMGFGDVKFCFAVMLWSPPLGMASLALGLMCMALIGVAFRRVTQPLIPYLAFSAVCLLALAAVRGLVVP